ncbi:MAG: DUF6314 family protein [Wenzhouxiangellaceae bacterium]|nr:DUF6314 family protein [Wenzhouxiangellaceae bacterium]
MANLLAQVERLDIESRGLGPGASRLLGRGAGKVSTERVDGSTWIFRESGRVYWLRPDSQPGATSLAFRNEMRWRVLSDRIELAHARFGPGREVPLAVLMEPGPRPKSTLFPNADLIAPEPHRCGRDQYRAGLRISPTGFDLLWRIEGLNKNERLTQRYRVGRGNA